MATFLFYYSLTVLLIYALASAVSLSTYLVSRRKTFLFASIMFIFYFFDCSLVFKDDFVTPQVVFQAPSFWEIGDPWIFIVTGAGVLMFLWLTVCQYLGKKRAVVRYAPILIFVLISVMFLLFFQNVRWREFLFFSTRELAFLFMVGFVVLTYLTTDNPMLKASIHRLGTPAVITFVMVIAIIVENVYLQLIFDPSVVPSDMWFFAERNPMENILFIYYAYLFFRDGKRTLDLRFDRPPERTDNAMAESIDRILPHYSVCHDLSKREEEVLKLVVMGKDNQNIASDLNLALSTIKVHVHNILKKTAMSDRHELTKDFWK